MTTTTKMEPKEIDKILSAAWEDQSRLRQRLERERASLKRFEALNTTKPKDWYPRAIGQHREEITKLEGTLAESREKSKPYEDEYRSRPWHRYFLVRQANGHIHREIYCSTCFPTTEYAWLVDLADCDEGQMVTQYGEKACTICFPNAPVHPAYVKAQTEREAAEKAKAESTCKGEGNWYNPNKRYADCQNCGKGFCTITPSGALRAHKRPEYENS